jgi:hypothetical protein
MSLPPLATVDDLTARLGRTLTASESSRVDALLRDSSVLIRRYCRRSFLYEEDDTVTLKADAGQIKLPGKPVIRVSSVVAKSGLPNVPDIPVFWYSFDGIETITILDASASGLINLPEIWYMVGAFPGTFIVTYTHGYTEYPDEVVAVCANSVLSVLMAPTMAAGVIGETIGAYSYRVTRAGGGIAVGLSESDMAALSDYRDRYGTLPTGGFRLCLSSAPVSR